ncbi:CpaD family pilus assembly lipoprotein [Sphingomonas sp.]|uniref:CpaD family pilus assembly protein n=1 Tax=Sphingomonas sp. TaxID=28214 RepID=UPI001ECDF96E|nr:CpaD family pilus assembly lipoprotein [Sphingomonas sp.]MBX3593125.1 CpaD family pilus assembly protein [Sphingomonas sp.]
MLKRHTILLLASAGATLSACGMDSGTTAYRGLESINQPVVQRTDYVFDAATDGAYLAPGEQARVAGWLASLRLAYGDRVFVDDPSGSRAREQIAAEAGRYGLLLSGPAPVTTGQMAPGTVRVIVSRMRAGVPGCPNWAGETTSYYGSTTSPNYGCSVNGNLAAMIARPEDLVRGQPGAETADPGQIAKSIKALRDAAPSGGGGTTLKAESTGGGSK